MVTPPQTAQQENPQTREPVLTADAAEGTPLEYLLVASSSFPALVSAARCVGIWRCPTRRASKCLGRLAPSWLQFHDAGAQVVAHFDALNVLGLASRRTPTPLA